jgi:hypothetical protein
MEYEFDSERGVHCFYNEIGEDGDYSFFYKANFELKNKVEVVYFESQDSNNKTKSVFVDYSDFQGLMNSEYVIQIIANEDSYSITISAAEVLVRSFEKVKAINIFDALFNYQSL